MNLKNDPDHVIGWNGDFWARFTAPEYGQKFPPVMLPNVNEGFTGRAPNLGALEVGRRIPHWGPR